MNSFTYEYLPLRGITKETLKFYDAKTKIDADGKPVAIGFKYPNGAYKVRWLNKKEFYTEGEIAKGGLFGKDKFNAGSHKAVTITEGEFDALSLYQVLRTPCVSVQSSVTAGRDSAADRSWLNEYERIYLAFDNDERGRSAAAAVARLFDFNKVFLVRFDTRKDANEYLQAGEHDELRNLWANARRYQPESVISTLTDFRKVLDKPLQRGLPYPFHTLNEMTYGIRTGESVLITAPEGVGKTELMHAIEHKILKETSHETGVGAIFLEEDKRRHLQALAGLELRKPVHLPDCDCTPDQAMAALEKVVGKDDRLHVYSHFGSDDPRIIEDIIRFLVVARSCRYILLDHVNMVVSGLGGEDERRALDYLTTRLEMMVKELDFALLMVSHINDFGLTRGSRYISKIADMRIDLKRDVTSEDPVERMTTHLTISKNRYCGQTGPAGKLIFDPKTYTLSEEVGFDAATDEVRGGDTELAVVESPTLVPSGADVRAPLHA